MKKLIGLLVIAMVLSVGMATLSYAADDTAASGAQAVKGGVLKIKGDVYVVKDPAGNEVRLHVDKTTRPDRVITSGGKVEAQATDKDHALSLKHVPSKK